MGISRRIPAIPKGFQVGETWVAFAHRKAHWGGNNEPARAHRRLDVRLREGSHDLVESLARRAGPQALAALAPGRRVVCDVARRPVWQGVAMTGFDLMLLASVALGGTAMLIVVILIGRLWR
jgi:hypothetical protein